MRRAKGNMMIRNSLNQLAVALLSLAGLGLCQQVALADVTMKLTGVNGANLGGVYTSPYQFTVGLNSGVWLVCDDFLTDIGVGWFWDANVYNLSNVKGHAKFQDLNATAPDGTVFTATVKEKYDAAAYLVEQLGMPTFPNPYVQSNSDATLISYAIWQIFDPTAWRGYSSQLTPGQQSTVKTYMTEAFDFDHQPTLPIPLSQVYIYTPNPASASQEFIGIGAPLNLHLETATVSEGSTPTLLAFNFLALPGIIFLLRRRILRSA